MFDRCLTRRVVPRAALGLPCEGVETMEISWDLFDIEDVEAWIQAVVEEGDGAQANSELRVAPWL